MDRACLLERHQATGAFSISGRVDAEFAITQSRSARVNAASPAPSSWIASRAYSSTMRVRSVVVRAVSGGIWIGTGRKRNGCGASSESPHTMSCTGACPFTISAIDEKSRGIRRQRMHTEPPVAAWIAATPLA